MRILVFCRLYNSFGGLKSISVVGDLLEFDAINFGQAITDLEITLNFFHDGPARKSLESMQENFHSNLKSLPKCTFYRKKRKLTLEIEGKFTTGYEIEKSRKPPITINSEWSKCTLVEIKNNLSLIKAKIKKNDDFDFVSFETLVEKKLESFPSDVSELEKIKEIVSSRKKEEFEKLDEWEKLGIDWDEYHSSARELVNHPFQWSCTDEFAPNGNDTGADILEMFKKWSRANKTTSVMKFLSKILSQWDIDINNAYESEYSSYTYFQTLVGLTFASAKIRGKCNPELKDLSVIAIDKYLESIANESKWQHRDDCIQKQNTNKETIIKMPNKSKHSDAVNGAGV